MLRPFLAAASLFLVLAAPLPAKSAEPQDREVLILHSYSLSQPWTNGIMGGMQKVLAEKPGIHVEVEYMDTKRYHDPEYLTRVLDTVLSYKLRRHSFDLVMLSDNDALNFALRHRHDLFRDTPIVFCGVNNFNPEMIAGVEGITGVAEYPNFRDTLKLVLKFHPRARRVTVIGGMTNETDRQNRRIFMAVAPQFAGELDFSFWDDVPWSRMRERFRKPGMGDVVFINGLVTDPDGDIVPYREVIGELHRIAPQVPVYSGWDFLLGDGIIGGKLVSSWRQGRLAAEMGERVLAGEAPASIPVVTQGANAWMFDWRELKRFGISLQALPSGSTIVNRPSPFLRLSRQEAWLLSGVGTVLVVSLVVLLVSSARQRRAEAALRESEERFRAIADYTHDMEVWTGTDWRLKWVNPSAERLTGYTQAEFLAMTDFPRPLLFEENADEVMSAYVTALEGRTSGNDYPFRFRRSNGDERWVAVSWQPIHSSRGEWLGMRSSLRDISERKAAETHLRELNEELDAFVRTVSHDLRGQLTPLIGFSEFLQKEYGACLDVTAREILAEIERGGLRMHALLEDLLALARVGYLEVPHEPVDSAAVAREVLMTLTPRVAEVGATVELKSLPPVYIHPCYLQQAFENLIANALRYGARRGGLVEIGGLVRPGVVSFYVRDHGPGVPDPEKNRIFDLFYRGDRREERGGTGVGLATVRRIARRCGGRAWVEDTPGGGATFWLEVESSPPRRLPDVLS